MLDNYLAPVQAAVLRDQVAASLRAAIASGALESGTRLVEGEIAARMKVSKAPVREALRLLEAEGLVATAPHKGTFVIRLSAADIREIHIVRAALERAAAGLFMERLEPEVLDELRGIVATMQAAQVDLDIQRLRDADFRFHQLIVQKSGNSRIVRLWSEMQGLTRMFMVQKKAMATKPTMSASRHALLLKTIESGDKSAFQAMLEQHVLDACRELESIVAATE